MRQIVIQNKLEAVHAGNASPLHKLISARVRLPQLDSPASNPPFWSAHWWGFDQSGFYSSLPTDTQRTVLDACNRTILNEAYFIEKSGLAYSAKMTLLAESTDVAQLYALIGADEAKHLAWLEPYILEEDKIHPYGEFLTFLSKIIEEAPPRLLVYLVQIILEGWGLDHYKHLAEGCQHPSLQDAFLAILKDEALHHKSGTLLFNPKDLTLDDWPIVRQAMMTYATMVRVGSWSAIHAIEQHVGFLTVEVIQELFVALKHSEASARKLGLLKPLMRQPGLEILVDELEAESLFEPLSVTSAAQCYVESR